MKNKQNVGKYIPYMDGMGHENCTELRPTEFTYCQVFTRYVCFFLEDF